MPSVGSKLINPSGRPGLVYTPRPQFLPFHNRPHRWATLVTHRRAGKTIALVNDVALAARTPLPLPDPQYAYIGPTFTQAKRVAWQYLKNYTRAHWAARPSESELHVTVGSPTGTSRIYCLGADNADSLRGMYLDGAMCDEYALWKPSVFSQIIRPALSDRLGWATFASTPRGKNLFHKQVQLAKRNPLEHFLLMLRADTSGIIGPKELASLRKDMDPEEFAQEYLCSFDAALKGAIYADEVNTLFADHRVHEGPDPLYDPHLDTHFIYDLGFTDATVRIAYQLPPLTGRVHIVNVLARSGVSIHEHIDDLRSFPGPIGSIHLPHDARAKNLQTGRSIVEQFIEYQIHPLIVPNHNVKDGISATRRLFPRLIIDNSPLLDPETGEDLGVGCGEDFIEALKGYHREWDDEKLVFSDAPVHDWTSDYADALRYLAVVVAPAVLTAPGAGHSSDVLLQSARDAQARTWRPRVGYNLETLHADHAAITVRTMP